MGKKIELEVRLSEEQIDKAEEILSILGLSMSETVSMFLAQVLLRGGLPFEVALPELDDQELMDRVYEALHSGSGDECRAKGQLSLDEDFDVPWDTDDAEDDACAV